TSGGDEHPSTITIWATLHQAIQGERSFFRLPLDGTSGGDEHPSTITIWATLHQAIQGERSFFRLPL
ncbi:hypothetical protein, partial [Escherichia coli]|uniref:hypothetical protein n=1 Tax=Escherichia coli TaxID=562 RepID=UPI001BC8B0C9